MPGPPQHMMMPREMHAAPGGGPMPTHPNMAYRRPSPYSHPHQAMIQRRQMMPSAGGQPRPVSALGRLAFAPLPGVAYLV